MSDKEFLQWLLTRLKKAQKMKSPAERHRKIADIAKDISLALGPLTKDEAFVTEGVKRSPAKSDDTPTPATFKWEDYVPRKPPTPMLFCRCRVCGGEWALMAASAPILMPDICPVCAAAAAAAEHDAREEARRKAIKEATGPRFFTTGKEPADKVNMEFEKALSFKEGMVEEEKERLRPLQNAKSIVTQLKGQLDRARTRICNQRTEIVRLEEARKNARAEVLQACVDAVTKVIKAKAYPGRNKKEVYYGLTWARNLMLQRVGR